jgi:YD repeat-containing protein
VNTDSSAPTKGVRRFAPSTRGAAAACYPPAPAPPGRPVPCLTNASGLRGHDPTPLWYRGNVTTSVTLGAIKWIAYDTTGAAIDAPNALTPNGNSNLSTSYTYNIFLGLTSVTEPNQAHSTIAYDSYGRPSSSTSPHGAVTTYTDPVVYLATTSSDTLLVWLELGPTMMSNTPGSTTQCMSRSSI